jgi:hypothetical protein
MDWQDGYAQLRSFVEREGHSNVPYAYCDGDGFKLGLWVGNQRTRRKRGQIPDDRARRLEALPAGSGRSVSGEYALAVAVPGHHQ